MKCSLSFLHLRRWLLLRLCMCTCCPKLTLLDATEDLLPALLLGDLMCELNLVRADVETFHTSVLQLAL